MKILTKLMLASAVMVTSGFATGIYETMTIEDGMVADNYACVNICSSGKLVMKGVDGASSNLTIKDQASVCNSGTVEMHDASAIISTTERDPAFENYGMLDVQNVTDFSNYSAVITSENESLIFISRKNAGFTPASSASFTVNVTQEDGESVKIRYYSTDAKLINESQIISISTTGDTYVNVDDVTATTGIEINDRKGSAVLEPIAKDV